MEFIRPEPLNIFQCPRIKPTPLYYHTLSPTLSDYFWLTFRLIVSLGEKNSSGIRSATGSE